MRLVDLAAEYEDKAVFFDVQTEEVVVVDPEAQAVADAIYEGIELTREAIGLDMSNIQVEALPGNVAGEYNTVTDQITGDLAAMTSANAEQIADILTHEGKHEENDREGDRELITSVALNEDLTETDAAAARGHDPIAYPEYRGTIEAVAQGANTTRENLFRLYRAGQNAEINALFAEAANNDEELAAAA